MNGTMLIYKPRTSEPEVRKFFRAPNLGDLKDGIGGGWVEQVPGFVWIDHKGQTRRCVAFVDEEGKKDWRTSGIGKREPDDINAAATMEWGKALLRIGHPGLLTPTGALADYLVGDVAVLYGDDEFMSEL